jgi:nitroreductase
LVKFSPSGYNLQPWNFIIFDKKKDLESLKKIAFNQAQFDTCSACAVVI